MRAQRMDSWCSSRFKERFLEEVMPEMNWPGQKRRDVHPKKSQSDAWNHIAKEEEVQVVWFI